MCDLPGISGDWEELTNDFKELEITNKIYQEKLEELDTLQKKCAKHISHQRYRLGIISSNLEGFKYKDEYEKFKLVLSIIAFVFSMLNLSVRFRVLELCNIFLLVWYYCTLTIRESILKVNGSRIKGWWRLHHFLSTVAAGILLIWPDQETWMEFRNQFMLFNAYISVVQYLQFRYQRGVLYRLKALGERHNMDITIEGFHSWMWRGLSFLLPFLFLGYLFQLYNAYVLYQLSYYPSSTWHVIVLSIMFFILFAGNVTTTIMVIPDKLKERVKLQYRLMSQSILKKRKFLEKEEGLKKD
ncbi:transmembrane protein induced by tumor necrosis factor alpha [Holotrichia oblita]|uniref:Transmembrane protein induced by tumor necrosis factor alpha n=3 Tax=Holotrichia oblita TaxID=644536 RepID=A0ACB9TWR3_HOLOL|nr:transmembrane protein induced by tumor necrosis factor alpha [Holotrichia oblita]KAI4471198.1 transmembrane protein induced by tumor necrosis factor alpha [Holotrichia oblita]KAI4471211.1 transmembrane protein induced by tumor necrosis factor alpha [Holotrichia oblita]